MVALDEGEWSASCPGHFTPMEETPVTHFIGGCVGLRTGLDVVMKRNFLPLPGIKPWLFSLYLSYYTD